MTETVTLPGLETTEPPEVVPTPAPGHWIERGPQKRLMVFSGRSHPVWTRNTSAPRIDSR